MSTGKKEIALLSILGILIYGLVFYKFIWNNVAAGISETKQALEAIVQQKASLDYDLKSIENKKAELKSKKILNERMDEYLMNSVNLVDGLEYIDKLANLINNKIVELQIHIPQERLISNASNQPKSSKNTEGTQNGSGKYYEMQMDLKTKMSYEEGMNLIRYIENSPKKATISQFSVKPSIEDEDEQASTDDSAEESEKETEKEKLFDIEMSISLYSMNNRASDRMFEYSRHKLGRYLNLDGVFIVAQKNSAKNDESLQTDLDISDGFETADIAIDEKSFLYAGENLMIMGVDRGGALLRVKTNKPHDIQITLDGSSYFINTLDSSGNPKSISGQLPQRDITLYIRADMPDIEENKNIKLNVKVMNNTPNKLKIKLVDKQKRVRLLDRNGAQIIDTSSIEKADIL